jgi:hypothetical protein
MYTETNFKSKKDLKAAVAAHQAGTGPAVRIFAPGLGTPKVDGQEFLEGPHYPKPHRWYAEVVMQGGNVVKVK